MHNVLTVGEYAARIRVHPSTIYRLAERGEIPHFKIAASIRIDPDAADRALFHDVPVHGLTEPEA